MSRDASDRLQDILSACAAIARYVERSDIDGDIVFDAIRVRLIEIGEAVKDLDETMTPSEPDAPCADIARMRDLLTHRYFDTTHAIVTTTARSDVPVLSEAVERILATLRDGR